MRKEIFFNDNWLFHLGDININFPKEKGVVYSQSKTERKIIGPAAYHYFDKPDPYAEEWEIKNDGWFYVTVPHDYIINQDNDINENNALGYFKYSNAWYRKHFSLSNEFKGKRVLLRFDGIAGHSTVYLNGCLMYRNFSSYNTFEIDISDYVYFDKENIVAIYVNAEEFEGWWYQGGGIYRDVHLTVTEPVAIDLWGVYAPYKKIGNNNWQINFETTVINSEYEDCSVIAESFVLNKDGDCVAKAGISGDINSRSKSIIKYTAKVENPLIWDTENPNLYTVKTVLKKDGVDIDENYIRIGFRTIEISVDNGLLLNGKQTVIKGVCAHQDFGITGLAVPENIARYKIKLIKEMGANGYRASHYQQSAATMDALDEMGFLVMNETRWFESTEESFKLIDALVRRDRNRPSVIFWSTGNEEYYFANDNGKRIHKAIASHIRQLDNTRFITAAVSETPEKSTVFGDCDIIGINYNLEKYDEVHENHPQKAVLASECCATGTTRDWHHASNTDGRIRDRDVDTNNWFLSREKTWKFLMSKSYVIGGYQWTAIEHRGEAMWPAICSKSGALDLFLQKKGAFYQNKSYWTTNPMVHIVTHWNFEGLEGEIIPVTVYTNCDELELFLNNESKGRIRIEKYSSGEWNIPYESGVLTVKGYVNGEVSAQDVCVTTKKSKKLQLTPLNEFEANGKDLALFLCECVDEDGFTVPDAEEFVKFSVAAPATIIGTGSDNCDHNNVTKSERQMYMGKILVAVKPQKEQKKLELFARSVGCGKCILKMDL